MSANRRRFLCLDCGIDTSKAREYYMLKDEVWLPVAPKTGMLCVLDVEKRLGRRLDAADFNDSYLNTSKKYERSTRLLERMECSRD